jgi:hypothetical protein
MISYLGGAVTQDKWSIRSAVYAESDLKNQPLQQSLTDEQIAVLQAAGDNPLAMYAPSAFEDTYAPTKVLYKKITANGLTYFEYSTDQTAVLYSVRFSLLGQNQGDYVLSNASVVGKIFEYVAPINGVKQGNYEPVIKLVAPTKTKIANVMG